MLSLSTVLIIDFVKCSDSEVFFIYYLDKKMTNHTL